MKIITLLLIIWSPYFIKAQEKSAVKWVSGLSWEQLKEKAKKDNKLIFVDCYATWCAPCKKMDNEVYIDSSVGNYMNSHFISIKIQIDKARNDNDEVKRWYEFAAFMQQEYHITTLPTYLFFGANGEILNKSMGFLKSDDFLKTASNSLNQGESYSSLMQKYSNSQKDSLVLRKLAIAAKDQSDKDFSIKVANQYLGMLSEHELYKNQVIEFIQLFPRMEKAKQIANNYKEKYLNNANESELLKKENLKFIQTFISLLTSKDSYFKLFYQRSSKQVDSILYKGASNAIVCHVIGKEEIDSKLWEGNKPITINPNWRKLAATIKKKYNTFYANSLLASSKESFYRRVKNWEKYMGIIDERVKTSYNDSNGERFNPWFEFNLNQWAWDIFEHCNDKNVLERALSWSELSIELIKNPIWGVENYDTKANILYKLGRITEALFWEEKAIALEKANRCMQGKLDDPIENTDYYKTLMKMKNGEPTWVVLEKK